MPKGKERKKPTKEEKLQDKQNYFAKLVKLVEEYPKILIVHADNVGSKHLQEIRKVLRGKGEILMGKNTRIRKAIKDHLDKNKKLAELLPHVKENVGFVFTKGDLREVRDKIAELKVAAPAKVDSLAPSDVTIFAGLTGLDPSQTALFQAINMATKINKSQIEILNDHVLLKKGDKIGNSEVLLLSKLSIKPFNYALTLRKVYDDGAVYDPEILDITDQDIHDKFARGVSNIAALSLALHFPVSAAVPHLLVNAFKNVLAISMETAFSFPQADKIKARLAAGPAPGAAPVAAKDEKKGGAKQEEKKKEPEKAKEPEPPAEEEADMGFGLFGDE